MNTNKNVNIDVESMIGSNKKIDSKGEAKCKAFFYNDVDLISTDGEKLASLTNNIVIIMRAKSSDGDTICYATYYYKVTCHGWSAKIPVHLTLIDSEGEIIKKYPLRELEVFTGNKNRSDSRVIYDLDPGSFEDLNGLTRGGDNSRWIRA